MDILVQWGTLYPTIWTALSTNPSLVFSIVSSLIIIGLVYKLQRRSSFPSGEQIAVFQAIGTNVPLNSAGGDYFKGIVSNFHGISFEIINRYRRKNLSSVCFLNIFV